MPKEDKVFINLKEFLLVLIVALLTYAIFLAPVAMVDVEVYKMEDGSYIYCATGSLTDPPATHISSGSVPVGDESYC